MKPETMTDEELVETRTVVQCVPVADGPGFDVLLSCGHDAVFAVEPHADYSVPCAQCVNLLVDRQKGEKV